LINNKITYDAVMKRCLRPRCPIFDRAVPSSCHRSPASLVIHAKERWNYYTL